MKFGIVILSILVIKVVIYFFIKQAKSSPSKASISGKTIQDQNVYEDLRIKALSVKSNELNLIVNENTVFGIVMDWEISGAVATVVSFATGDASLYLSSGGGVVGGGQHQNIHDAAKRFVQEAQPYLFHATKSETTALPSLNSLSFYLLTDNGIYFGQEQMSKIENKTSIWYPLFIEANNVLNGLREVSEN